jgi:phosphatidylinositol alpha-mannosyltransferase
MKVGIVVPFSWSFWGAVNEHAELQADALRRIGVETRTIIGNDPPGAFTRALHPRHGRHGEPPLDVLPVGRSVIVPANGSLPNIVLSPTTPFRIRSILQRERFDVIHVHEPMTPAICVAALAFARCPIVATWHAAGDLRWYRFGVHLWGSLIDRIDHRIAVSEQARDSAANWLPGEYEVIPNGVLIPPRAEVAGRDNRIVFIGRHDPRKGMPILLRAWPEVHRHTGARLRLVGADPLAVRLVLARARVPEAGIDVLGFLSQDELTAELLAAKALVAPSVGMESFGMVLTRAFACATPVVASDIPGYRAVMTPETGRLVPPGEVAALAQALIGLLGDEPRRLALGTAARRIAEDRYSWVEIARRLKDIYESVTEHPLLELAAVR